MQTSVEKLSKAFLVVLCFVLTLSSLPLFSQEESYKLFCGNANPKLAKAVADYLDMPLSELKLNRFSDGEIQIQIEESVRNCNVFLLQSTCSSHGSTVNDSLIELYLLTRAMKRASAKSVTAIIPYYGYARQDRKLKSRVPISASDVAMLMETAGVDHIISVDLHCGQIQGFFHNAPVDNLYASRIFLPYMASKTDLYNPVVVSPDAGGVERAKQFISGLHHYGIDSQLAIIIKQRKEAGVVDKMDLVGTVEDCDVIIIDDICDTAGTLAKAAAELKANGARRVFACITHPVFSGNAFNNIANSTIDELVVTDTISLRSSLPPNVTQLTVAPLIGEAIRCLQNGSSISHLFMYDKAQ